MIVLQDGEQILRQDDATLENEGRSLSEGTLYLTSARIMFESKDGGVPRMLSIKAIQATTPLRENRLAVSYLSEDGREIHTDKYRLKGRARVEEWYDDFSAFLRSRRTEAPETGREETRSDPDIFAGEDASQAGRSQSFSAAQARGEQYTSTVQIDLSSRTMDWQRIPGWRKFQDEHIWQGRQRMKEMTKEQWLAYKREATTLYEKLSELRVEYFNAKKTSNKERCIEIKEEMKMLTLELNGKEFVPYSDIEADTA